MSGVDLRILFVTAHKHIPELRAGLEVNTHELCKALQARGAAVAVLCGLAGRGVVGLWARARIRLLHDLAPRDRMLGYPTWRAWDVVPQVHRVARAFRPDVIVVQGGAEFYSLIRTCLDVGRPVVYYAHTSDRLPLKAELADRRDLHFIVNSRYTAALHPDKTIGTIIRPLVPCARYATSTDRTVAVFVNPAPHKGLAVVERLVSERPDVEFLYVVSGSRDAVARGNAGLPRNVHVTGPVRDMRSVYRRAKVVLAPSQCDETWGRVATEAHMSAIPVLASSRGGLPEAVGPGGICLDAESPAPAWAEAFSALWDDEARYRQFVEASRAFSQRAEIDVDKIVDSFVAFMLSITDRGHA